MVQPAKKLIPKKIGDCIKQKKKSLWNLLFLSACVPLLHIGYINVSQYGDFTKRNNNK